MAQNSRTALWTKFWNNLALTGYFLPHITCRVMENLRFFTNTSNQLWKKLCEKDPANWDKYINQVLASYRITPNLATVESPFFLVYGQDPNSPLHQLLEPMQCFLGDPDSGKIILETHRQALAIAKKTLDENRFTGSQNTVSRDNPTFNVGDHVYFKK